MKHCSACGVENIDEARFCMKCGNDLDVVDVEVPPLVGDEPGAPPGQTPVEKKPRGKGRRSRKKGPLPDAGEYRRPDSPIVEKISHLGQEQYGKGQPEIQSRDVRANFAENLKFCDQCGMSNPRDMKYCKNCGNLLDYSMSQAVPPDVQVEGAEPFSAPPSEAHVAPRTETPHGGYYGEPPTVPGFRSRRFNWSIYDWSARSWVLLIVAAVVIAAIVWFFAYGGMRIFFSSSAKNIKKAGTAMTSLASFQYVLDVSMEDAQGIYKGSGSLEWESPDKSRSSVSPGIPGLPAIVQHLQIDKTPFANTGAGWQVSDPKITSFDVRSLWSNFSNVEDVGKQEGGAGYDLHYKYRIPPEPVTGLIGIWQPEIVSDAVMEVWIDPASFQIKQIKSEVYNLKIQGIRTKATITFILVGTGQPLNIAAPI